MFQDLRGKFGSEGVFVMQRPARAPGDTKALDEGTDTYDTISWLLANVPGNNGRVGMLGVSYDGWTTIMAALEPHPALAAISPQASPADMWLGDDFHHNGAFRLSYGLEYAFELESEKNLKQFGFDRYDTYPWYLALGPLSNVNARFFHGKIPTWNDFVAHPDYDAFWKRQTMIPYLREVKVPTLNVAGWWDQEDFYGPLRIYAALEKNDPRNVNRLVVGPWNHGGWTRGDGDKLGAIPFDSATAKYFREEIQTPWFAHYLKGRGADDAARSRHVRSGLEPLAELGGLAARPPHRGAEPVFRSRRHALLRGARRSRGRTRSTPTSPIPRIRCRIGSGRSRRPTFPAARSGRPGSSRTSGSSTTAPTS